MGDYILLHIVSPEGEMAEQLDRCDLLWTDIVLNTIYEGLSVDCFKSRGFIADLFKFRFFFSSDHSK